MSGTGPRRSREPMESDDQVSIASQRSPTFARRDIAGSSASQATESSSQARDSNVDNLPQLIDDVALTEKEAFPPSEFTGTLSGTAFDNDMNISPKYDSERKQSTDSSVTEQDSRAKISEQVRNRGHVDEETTEQNPVSSSPRPKLRRKSSSLAVKVTSLPKVNCQEKIILCIDHSEAMFKNKFQTQSANQTSVFKTLNSALKQFVRTKSFLNKKHQFSLVMLNDDAQLITDFSPSYEELLFMLKDITESHTHSKGSTVDDGDEVFDLTKLFDVIKQQCSLPRASPKHHGKAPPPHVVRVIFVYGRSDSRPKFLGGQKNFALLNNNPYFFVDCVYIHEPAQANNMVETIFSEICSLDIRGTSHVYEVGTDSNIACLYNILAKLLAHPLQRPKQGESPINYNLELE